MPPEWMNKVIADAHEAIAEMNPVDLEFIRNQMYEFFPIWDEDEWLRRDESLRTAVHEADTHELRALIAEMAKGGQG